MTRSPARLEREQLCDLALATGPDAPTLCGEWDVRHLMAHLLVRDRQPHNAVGIVARAFASRHDDAVARVAGEDFATTVGAVRAARSPLALPGVDVLANTIEYFVHHEDIRRRAGAAWSPRELPDATVKALWRALPLVGRLIVRDADIPIQLRRTDTGATLQLRRGPHPVVLVGEVAELVLYLYGRGSVADVAFEGPDAHITALKSADLGL
ncbi:TIGR03085 family metal-binding protein [Nocardioides jiangxiensis]|uniref:TIGR03085 family metal-binding protein n=1 Tax=Nocardioides jiangxiensis TaxID=3064524 RepID=A0ABT9B3S5_9ACTN|nr:TIGR03085 family metal-binding protein [Nocardioides sp. WY-20]MDO7869377.1 TIGR03085 family metal-binding protein [Nocardioides sp. WY-20]